MRLESKRGPGKRKADACDGGDAAPKRRRRRKDEDDTSESSGSESDSPAPTLDGATSVVNDDGDPIGNAMNNTTSDTEAGSGGKFGGGIPPSTPSSPPIVALPSPLPSVPLEEDFSEDSQHSDYTVNVGWETPPRPPTLPPRRDIVDLPWDIIEGEETPDDEDFLLQRWSTQAGRERSWDGGEDSRSESSSSRTSMSTKPSSSSSAADSSPSYPSKGGSGADGDDESGDGDGDGDVGVGGDEGMDMDGADHPHAVPHAMPISVANISVEMDGYTHKIAYLQSSNQFVARCGVHGLLCSRRRAAYPGSLAGGLLLN